MLSYGLLATRDKLRVPLIMSSTYKGNTFEFATLESAASLKPKK